MRIHRSISFSHEEQQIIQRAALSVRIAFGDYPRKDDPNFKKDWNAYGGRSLLACAHAANDPLSAKQIEEAVTAIDTLVITLALATTREYWERQLTPKKRRYNVETDTVTSAEPVAGLVAPGTDIAGMLAETRMAQYREALAAQVLINEAARLVGPPEKTEIQEDREGI